MPLALEPGRPVLALCAVMARPPLLDGVAADLEKEIGPVGHRGPAYRFDYTSYYEGEMGGELCKQVLAFADLVLPHRLAELKGRAMEIEMRPSAINAVAARARPRRIRGHHCGTISRSSIARACQPQPVSERVPREHRPRTNARRVHMPWQGWFRG